MKTLFYWMAMAIGMIPSVIFGAGGDHINNGGGLAEKNVLLAYSTFERYLEACLNLESCRLNPRERDLLREIMIGMPKEREARGQIIFQSERSNPGLFLIDGEIKIAKTGNSIGSPIYINTDLLYTRNSFGLYEPLSLADSVSVLVHEFGHHHGKDSHTELDILGLKVSSQMRRLTYMTPLLPLQHHQVSLHVLNGTTVTAFPDTLLYVKDVVVDITQQLRKAVVCPLISIPISIIFIDPLTIPSHAPRAVLLHNLHWDEVDNSRHSIDFEAIGNLTLDCDGRGLARGNQSFTVQISFTVQRRFLPDGGSEWVYLPATLRVRQMRKSWLKIISLPWF